MKNKKTFVGIALLIVVLVIGIGYAAITDSLTICFKSYIKYLSRVKIGQERSILSK